MKRPKVSIVTITYNHEKYIREALDSFLAQKTDFEFEVIIADDASTDQNQKIIMEYATKHPKIFKPIMREKNIGVANNFIDAIQKAEGEYIALCEGDDFWNDPEKLQVQVNFLEKNKEYALCFHPMREFFQNNEKHTSIYPQFRDNIKLEVKDLLEQNFIPSHSVMYRRQDYKQLPSNVMPLDWYMHTYHAQFGKIGFMNKVMSSYRRHSGGIWWDSFKDQDLLWKNYGMSMLALYSEFMKMYGDNQDCREVISKAVYDALTKLAKIDQNLGDNLVKKALLDYPELCEKGLIYQQQQQVELTEALKNREQDIETLTQEVLDLRSLSFRLKDELHTIKNSRIFGRILKLRNYYGESRKKYVNLPRRILNKIRSKIRIIKTNIKKSLKRQTTTEGVFYKMRVIVAPFIPGKIRRAIKKIYARGERVLTRIQFPGKSLNKFRVILGSFMLRVSRHAKGNRKSSSVVAVNNKQQKNNLPLVSVIIPYYNRADTIDDTLSSVEAQSFKNYEIIIVDDGSTDVASVQKLKDLKASDLQASIVTQLNQGVAVARNNGVRKSRGKYVICLDSDDMLESTFIEKSTIVLESQPDVSLVTTHREDFGVLQGPSNNSPYNPLQLYSNNMVITAAEFRKEAWNVSGGYKSGIGYEDWEFWMNLSEHGFWGKLLPERLFRYRVAMQSRYIEDKDLHWNNMKNIRAIHPKYKAIVSKLITERQTTKNIVTPETAFINLNNPKYYQDANNQNPKILITIPWMTFGGAETLMYNYCREVKDKFNLSFVTGLKSDHEWEYKFREITPNVYHLANLFEDEDLHMEFISNYIKTRNIGVLHIIHNGFTFKMLPELCKRHPDLKIVVTLFNDRVAYFEQSIDSMEYINEYTTDNAKVAEHYKKRLGEEKKVTVIPNGINCYNEYSPSLFNRSNVRADLGLDDKDLAVFFVGRLSEEKNPVIFLEAAQQLLKEGNNLLKFFIIGNGPMKPQVERRIAHIGSKNIKYLGYQSAVAEYLSAADIFVLPSSIEGFPLSILEAMAMEVAVIASDVGAVSEVISIENTGFVVTPGSAKEISDIILMLKHNPKLLKEIKINARKTVEEKYSNITLGDNYKKLYEGLSK